jgi:hypothetical protein
MKRLAFILIGLSIVMFACNIANTPTPLAGTNPPGVTVSPTSGLPAANTTCNEISLYLDPALASGHDCQTIPETSPDAPPFDSAPQHTELTLQGYPLADRFFTPHISVYPVERFSQMLPDSVPQRVAAMQALIGGGAYGKSIPFLPVFNAAQEFYVQNSLLTFQNGSGIRFVTQFSQYADPINNHEAFYAFQGLTADGKYWISVFLPVSNPLFLETGDNPPNGQTWDQFSNNFDVYIADLKTQLNNQQPAGYTPALAGMDALVRSIRIQP